MTPQEVTELYDTYSSLYKSALNGTSRSASDVVDPIELAKKLRPMNVEELEAYRDSILAAHPEYQTKAMDPQAYINLLLKHFTAEEVAAFLTFTEDYPFQEDKPGYLQYSTLGLQPQLQRMYVSAAAGIDNAVVPFAEYTLDQSMEMVAVHISEGALYAECEHQLVRGLMWMLGENIAVAVFSGGVTIEGLVEGDIPHVLLLLISYEACKKGIHL